MVRKNLARRNAATCSSVLLALLPACSWWVDTEGYRSGQNEPPIEDPGACVDASDCPSPPRDDDAGREGDCSDPNGCPSPLVEDGAGGRGECEDPSDCLSPPPIPIGQGGKGGQGGQDGQGGLAGDCGDSCTDPEDNAPPSAGADAFQAGIDSPLDVPAPGLLANDADPDGGSLTASAATVTTALGGSVTLGVSGAFTYTPPHVISYPVTADTFEYTVVDARGATATGVVRIDFVAAVVDRYRLARGSSSFSVEAASGLLSNDAGSGVRALVSAGATQKGGTFSVQEDGSFDYAPHSPTFWGDDAFDYTLTDGTHQTSGRVRIVVQPGILHFEDIATEQGNGFALDVGLGDTFSGEAIAAAGDPDGDGLADLLVIANGRAYLVHGSRRTFILDLAFVGSDVATGTVFTSAETLTAVAGVGDVNADSVDDIAVATTTTAFVVFGGGSDTLLDLDQLASGSDPRGFAITGGNFSRGAPSPVAGAGDVNGDGFSDVILGDPFFEGVRGRAHVIFGKMSTAPIHLELGGLIDGFNIEGVTFGEFTGWAVAGAGDVNGDGLDDVIVGSHQSFTNEVSTGKAYVVFGKRDRGSVALSEIASGTGNGFAVVGVARNDFVGHSVAGAGDVDGDGLDDVVIGAPFAYGENDTAGPGGAFVVFGKADAAPVLASALQAGSSGGFAIRGVSVSDQTGFSVSGAGDVNGDGRSDVIVGAFNRGAHVVLGKATTESVLLGDFPNFALGASIITGVERNSIGAPVSGGGDIDGDGLSDVLIGSTSSDPNGLTFYTLFGWDMTATLADREGALRGGPEANTFELPRRMPISIRGGNGNDTLRVQHSGVTLDLTAAVPCIESVETFDLRGGGPQVLRADDRSIRRVPSRRNGVPSPLVKTLVVLGDAEDRFEFDFAGYERIADNAARAVYRKSGAFYGLEVSPALAPP